MLKLKAVHLSEILPVRKEIFGLKVFDYDGDDSLHVLASDNDLPAGCVSLKTEGENVVIYALGVTESNRGRMTGEALLKMAEFLALNRNCNTSFCQPENAEGFFKKFGYEQKDGKLVKHLSDGCNCCSHKKDKPAD